MHNYFSEEGNAKHSFNVSGNQLIWQLCCQTPSKVIVLGDPNLRKGK